MHFESVAHPSPLAAPVTPVVAADAAPRGTPARRAALVELMDDASPRVWSSVRAELERLGPLGLALVRRAARGTAARARSRARAWLRARDRERTLRRISTRVLRDDVELEQALWLLAQLEDPRFDARPFRRVLEGYAAEVGRRAAAEHDARARALELIDYLAGELGFSGPEQDYHHSDNIHLHRALLRRRGMPLTLCAIFILVARRAGIGATCIPLPRHVVLRIRVDGEELLFDPFARAAQLTRAQCEDFLRRQGFEPHPALFEDADDGMLIQRHLRNLATSRQRRGRAREAAELFAIADAMHRARAARSRRASGSPRAERS
jgi:regulator of sirC expression with transglutaminase-like and TPR domain